PKESAKEGDPSQGVQSGVKVAVRIFDTPRALAVGVSTEVYGGNSSTRQTAFSRNCWEAATTSGSSRGRD
ncbi:hypothetical protein, partial [Thermus sp.]|uniref:hypothetical protein n=1 Tax=Thermus sp. TaxID=275 RepID=UPI0025E7CA3A